MLIGVSNNNLAAFDAALGQPVPVVRDYTTFDTPAPAGWKALAADRQLQVSIKPKINGVIVPFSDVLGHKYDSQLKQHIEWLMACGIRALEPDHEVDAKTAAAGGTPAQLDQMILYIFEFAAGLGWKGDLVAGLTGYDEVDRGPLFAPILTAATKVMVDSGYATAGNPAFADAAGPSIDWLTATYPGKPIIIGELGSTAYAGRQAWIVDAGNQLLTNPRFAPVVEAIWWNNTTGSFDTTLTGADMAAWVAVMKAALVPPPPIDPLQAQLNAALAQVAALTAQLGTAGQTNAAQAAQITGLQGQYAAAQTQVAKLQAQITAAKAAGTTLMTALDGSPTISSHLYPA